MRFRRKLGARSIRGAMGTYFWVSAGALVLLAAVLWWGWGLGDPSAGASRVHLAADAGWRHAALEGGGELLTLLPGDELSAPPGRYRITLVPKSGEPVLVTLELRPGGRVELGGAARSAGPAGSAPESAAGPDTDGD